MRAHERLRITRILSRRRDPPEAGAFRSEPRAVRSPGLDRSRPFAAATHRGSIASLLDSRCSEDLEARRRARRPERKASLKASRCQPANRITMAAVIQPSPCLPTQRTEPACARIPGKVPPLRRVMGSSPDNPRRPGRRRRRSRTSTAAPASSETAWRKRRRRVASSYWSWPPRTGGRRRR
jgi:hypothetical protein